MNCSYLIKKQLDSIGNQVYLQDGEWISMPFYACLNHLWRKKTSSFEDVVSEIGSSVAEYYLYIGPKEHNIETLSDNAVLIWDDIKFVFRRREAVKVGNETVYYTAILRKVKEAEYEEY